MYLKVHDNARGRVIAACDEELIGKILCEGEVTLDLDKYRSFYVGEKVTEKELVEQFSKRFTSANLVGRKVVNALIKTELLEEDDVNYVKKVPYAQIYLV